MGELGAAYPDFRRFLEELESTGPIENERFVGRNFRLDERVPDERLPSYATVAVVPPSTFDNWNDAHGDYLAEALWVAQPAAGLPTRVQPDDPTTCAESFRAAEAIADLGGTDASAELVRVERTTSIAAAAGVSESEAQHHLDAVATTQNPTSASWVDAVLGRWTRTRDLRPAWASFWEDCADLLEGRATNPDWAADLRDRLGLAHFDPAVSGRSVSVVVFRYPVRIVPTIGGVSARRALAFPTVIDGEFSFAFAPTPMESRGGRAVDLAGRGADPFQEVIHPPVRLRAEHVFAVGSVGLSATIALDDARGLHLLWLQDVYDRPDFAAATDPDLFV